MQLPLKILLCLFLLAPQVSAQAPVTVSHGTATAEAPTAEPIDAPQSPILPRYGVLPAHTANEPLPAILERIARCESGQRQFNADGSVLRGRENPKDVGYFQINEYYWLAEAERLGYDIYTLDGNRQMALYIYHKQGLSAWSASEFCWR